MNVEVKYDLHLLGWYSFQQLCLTISREILGQTVENFLDTNDGGRDGAFSGTWIQKGQEALTGHFVIQCKFTNKRDSKLKLSDIKEELVKAQRLVEEGRCDSYVLMTNTGISGNKTELITTALKNVGVKNIKIFGSSWICSQIHESNRLRMLVPRVYGLGDLSQILDERAYAQARQLLASMREELAKIVITKAYNQAVAALNKHGFVLLIGEPAAGKTTIASLLAMAALDQWNSQTLKLDIPQKVKEHWNPEDPRQFFWIDDAFGVTQYESNLAKGWNHIMPEIKSMLNQGIKIVMTSRDYIYKRARNDLKIAAFPLVNESQVVIDVHNLETVEKEQILYNHLKLGHQNNEFRKQIKPFLPVVANHHRFIPETARRLAAPIFTKGLWISEYYLKEFVDKQEGFLRDVISNLDDHCKASLGLIYMNNDQLLSPIRVTEQEKSAIEKLGSSEGSCIKALESLDGSLVQLTTIDNSQMWRFKHPTISDAYAAIVASSSELLEIYIRGTSAEKLMEQVTCGEVGLEKAVVIGKNLYPLLIQRIENFEGSHGYKTWYLSSWSAKRNLYTFLARRCDEDFLKLYLGKHISIFDDVAKPRLSFHYSQEISLAIRLNELKLLPEESRKSLVNYVTDIAVNGKDLYILENENFQSIFVASELIELKKQVRDKLITNLVSVRQEFEREFKASEEEADEYMDSYSEILSTLKNEFENEDSIVDIISNEKSILKEWIDKNATSNKTKLADRELGQINGSLLTSSRSIFDDIDA